MKPAMAASSAAIERPTSRSKLSRPKPGRKPSAFWILSPKVTVKYAEE